MSLNAPLLKISRWLKPRSRGRVRQPEPADLGTAFGMECWLDESLPMPLPAAGRGGADGRGRHRWLPGWLQQTRRG